MHEEPGHPYSQWKEGQCSPTDAIDNWRKRSSSFDRPAWAWKPTADEFRSAGSPLREVGPSSPRPPTLSLPSTPSTEYLPAASSPSASSVEAPRKLLILDLNGTLLVCVSSCGMIHLRPYMAAFRAYLFAEVTRSWLDVMVWSSARSRTMSIAWFRNASFIWRAVLATAR